MEQQDQLLELAEDALHKLGLLTPWKSGQPPCIGWWRTRIASNPNFVGGDRLRKELNEGGRRQYWHGSAWSLPVWSEDPDSDAVQAQLTISSRDPACIEWCGLTEPHADGYTPEVWEALDKIYPPTEKETP